MSASSHRSPDLPLPFDPRSIHRALLRWYRADKRPMPWRDIDDPYRVFVSEYMLQQTQVARVMEKFDGWLALFPTITDLAAAPRRSVLLAWAGFGYNRRAINLHEAAQIITERFGGRIPSEPDVLQALPGIGRYTASAIRCFGWRIRTPVVDVNIHRVLMRLVGRSTLAERDAWRLADQMLPLRTSYDWNQALMDLGASICTALRPRCGGCPLRASCLSVDHVEIPSRARTSAVRETPRRVHRGVLVESLRRAPTHTLPLLVAGATIRKGFSEADILWFADILRGLLRDRLITLRHDNGEPADPAAITFDSGLHIALAE